MPRKTREREEGAYFHVYTRGNRRCAVFHDDEDRRWFLDRLLRVENETGTHHVAHCLMSNHVHLLIQPGEAGISRVVHRLLGPYTQWFNKRHGCVGHVFQGRFGSRVIESDEDFLTVLRYIHRNPVEAGMVPRPELWKWSSHADHLRLVPPDYLGEGARQARRLLADDSQRALINYRRLVENPSGELLIPVESEAGSGSPPSGPVAMTVRPGLDEIARRTESGLSVEAGGLAGASRERRVTEARRAFCHEAAFVHAYTHGEIAAYLGRSRSNISGILKTAVPDPFPGKGMATSEVGPESDRSESDGA